MALICSCSHCGAQHRLKESLLGKKVRCKDCSKVLLSQNRTGKILRALRPATQRSRQRQAAEDLAGLRVARKTRKFDGLAAAPLAATTMTGTNRVRPLTCLGSSAVVCWPCSLWH
jgi:predicted Zn finger-like uncharacterized protein